MHKNIYIATPVDMGNYGNRLQNFAVHRISEKVGVHPVTLAVDNKRYGRLSKHLVVDCLSKVRFDKICSATHSFNSVVKSIKAWRFTKKWIETRYVFSTFNPRSIEADALVGIGGDQIWSPYWHGVVPFCNFIGIDPSRKICFAPSFGTDQLPEEYENLIAGELKSIAHPRIREASGAEIVTRLTGNPAQTIADPVLGLSKDDWDSFVKEEHINVPEGDYVVTYLLGKVSKERKAWIQRETNENGYSIVDLAGNVNGKVYVSSPLEFVKLISCAEYVLTDSYHAILFALLYGRSLVVFQRDGGEKMNTRIQYVVETYSLKDSWFNINKHIDEHSYDIKEAQKILEDDRNAALSYFQSFSQEKKENKFEMTCYKAFSTNDEIRNISSSGGIFYHLGSSILDEGGCVVGAEMESDGKVKLGVAFGTEQLRNFCGSKYVQAETGTVYRSVELYLKSGRKVLFSGTPCQCNALHSYLGRDYDNLVTVDLICHGVPTQGVWHKYFESLNKEKRVVGVNFRDKREGWNNFGLAVRYEDNTEAFTRKVDETYLQFFSRNFSLRPSCYKCRSKGAHRMADITLADFWGVRDKLDDKGYSACIAHTEKGEKLLELVNSVVELRETSFSDIVSKNQNYSTAVGKPFGRKRFFKALADDIPVFDNLVKYSRVTFCEKVVRFGLRKLRTHGILKDNHAQVNYIDGLRTQLRPGKYKSNCSGCGACCNACPTGAISMKLDDEGAVYPVFDKSVCINCNKCSKACYNPLR